VLVWVGWLLGWLVGGHLMFRNFGPCRTIFKNACVVITAAMIMLLNLGLAYYLRFSRHS
jgi:hypothetical protein